MKWEESYNTGIDQCDEDHKYLISQLLEVKKNLDSSNLKDIKEILIPEIVTFTKKHFKREEVIMKDINYPYFDFHKKLHRSFLDQIDNLVDQANKIIDDNLERLFNPMYNFIIEWMMSHILFEDKTFGQYYLKMTNELEESCV